MKKVLILFIFLSTNVFAEINLTKIKDGLTVRGHCLLLMMENI